MHVEAAYNLGDQLIQGYDKCKCLGKNELDESFFDETVRPLTILENNQSNLSSLSNASKNFGSHFLLGCRIVFAREAVGNAVLGVLRIYNCPSF
jgi:hypothetical protein